MYLDRNTILKRETASVKYLQEIDKLPGLTAQEESALFHAYVEGKDEKIKQRIIEANLRFVVSVAKTFQNYNNVSIVDLINEGNIGLLKAFDRFEPTKGFKFISFAVWEIRRTIQDYLEANLTTVRVPVGEKRKIVKIYINKIT